MLVHLFRRALVSTSARGHASARPGAHRRAADRPVCSARAGRMAVVRRSRDHSAGSRRPRAARRSDRRRSRASRQQSRSGSCRCCSLSFGSVSLISPLANVVAIPLFTLLHRAHCAARGAVPRRCGCLPANGCWQCPTQLLQWTWPLLQWLAKCPLALWHFPQPPVAAFVALVVGVVLLVAPGIWPTRLAGVLLCLPVALHRVPGPGVGNFELTMLDVGQGLAVVVRTQAHVLVYDAGPAFPSGRDAGELAVLPYLRHRGVRQLDALVISHGDLDHRGGANSVLAGLPVARVLAGPSVGRLSRPHAPCRRGQRWTWDGVEFEVLHPAHSARAQRQRFVLRPARAQRRRQRAARRGRGSAVPSRKSSTADLSPATVVVVPHHGSRTSSSAPFVAAARPALALVSAGYRNRWGLPRREVVERWRAAGARVLTTADSGAIEITFAAGRPPVAREYRQTRRRYWHR